MKGDNLPHITTSMVVQALGMNAGLLWKARSCQVLGLVLTLALVFAPGYLSAQSCAPPPTGLVGWWPLDETGGTTVSDHSGLGNHGTTSSLSGIGPQGPPKSVAGFVGNGLVFFFGSRVNVPANSSLDFGTNTSFTIDAWINGGPSPFVGNFDINTKVGYAFAFGDSGVLVFQMGDPGGTWNGPALTRDVWTFVAVVVDRQHKTVTLYTDAGSPGTPLSSSPSSAIASTLSAGSGLPLHIGGCPGNPNGCHTIIDEVEIFNRALTQAELQSIFDAGSAGKCKMGIKRKMGMTWVHSASNAQTGTITVGCRPTGSSACDPIHGDTLCTELRPLLCIYKPAPPFQVPAGVNNSDQYNRWSGGVVATTQPVAGSTFAHISATPGTDANSYCATQFGPGWRVAEFHDGWGWNFQAYGGTVSAPTVPSTRFWVHVNDQRDANCWATP
jgi:hypothetical protein